MGGDKEEDDDDRRREAAIASMAALRPNNFKPKGVTQTQLSKFQELHRKRLQIKSKSKCEKKPKAGAGKSLRKHKTGSDSVNQDSSLTVENSADESQNDGSSSSVQQEEAPKKRKLHWGLDTKERWERKANM